MLDRVVLAQAVQRYLDRFVLDMEAAWLGLVWEECVVGIWEKSDVRKCLFGQIGYGSLVR